MPKYDREFIDAAVARLEKLTPESQPLWGEMTCAKMMGHLNMSIIYSLGNLPEFPAADTWFTRNIVGKIILNGLKQLPKNLKPSRPEGSPEPPPPPDGTAEMLKGAMEMYLTALEKGEFKANRHPLFGDIGSKGWGKMHCVHIDHHLRQFGV